MDLKSFTSDDTSSTTLNNIGSATINLSDDSVEAGGDGNIEAMTIDTTDDATITVDLGANQEAATAAAADAAVAAQRGRARSALQRAHLAGERFPPNFFMSLRENRVKQFRCFSFYQKHCRFFWTRRMSCSWLWLAVWDSYGHDISGWLGGG